VRNNLRRLGYYAIGVVCAGFLAFGLMYAPATLPAAGIGLIVGAVVGAMWPLRSRKRPAWFGTGLTLATGGGLLLSTLARALIHDQNVLNSVGAAGLAAIVGWDLVFASRAVLRERSAWTGTPPPM